MHQWHHCTSSYPGNQGGPDDLVVLVYPRKKSYRKFNWILDINEQIHKVSSWLKVDGEQFTAAQLPNSD